MTVVNKSEDEGIFKEETRSTLFYHPERNFLRTRGVCGHSGFPLTFCFIYLLHRAKENIGISLSEPK
jgi:hypothetical protein